MIAPYPVKIIVIGAGLIGPRHAQHVHDNPLTELMAIIDPQPSTTEIADRLNTLHFPSITTFIEYCNTRKLPYPDGAIVCTPNHTHVKVSAELASYGINLLVEKPIGSTPQEAKSLKMYTSMKDVKVLVGHHRRFNPYIMEAKRNLHKCGDIVGVQGSWMLCKPQDYFEIAPWRTQSSAGGVLLINLVHDLDLLQFLFGPILRIYAELLPKRRDHEADEGAALTIKFKNGISGTFICSDNVTSPFNFENATGENPMIPHHSEINGIYRIFGSKGTLSLPEMTLFHQSHIKNSTWLQPLTEEKIEFNREELPFDSQLNHFVDVIRGNAEPYCCIDDGISALLCIDAVLKSIDTGMPVMVEDVKNIKPNDEALGF
ncbi:uncharacterized protein SPAPADRAFT_63741 [Spathaspora passalidarum NRRL Y-27907]|uniref:Oxidoreductase n=1 Tax=Spathaspora passalidarum (strain NRRL Y-27907 / 11-Y1) TaxID=619300 RepID=G3AVB2_SPAPN|nr:uncharacterized protein SPAPADRAFT_63741 [Spathaspora passalidarum NRRL Y-27907]EGW30131.1 hypothetical protein SPAPADRAFT_63741 [Spathaspora passalidarum NRRL Y-27907]